MIGMVDCNRDGIVWRWKETTDGTGFLYHISCKVNRRLDTNKPLWTVRRLYVLDNKTLHIRNSGGEANHRFSNHIVVLIGV
jgi:hypothetical protein